MIPIIGANRADEPAFDPTARFIVMQWPPFTAIDPGSMDLLATRTGLPYLERTAGIQAVKRARTPVGDSVRMFGEVPLPPVVIAKMTAALLSSPTFAGGAILDQLPLTKFEAVELAKFVQIALVIDLGASVGDLTHRADEDRRCMICRNPYQWRRPPARRALMCVKPGCGGLLRPIEGHKAERRVATQLEKSAELAAYYKGLGVPHVVLPTGNEVTEDAMLELLVGAISAQPGISPVSPGATS